MLQVGRISYYDAEDIVLIPVTEYPIVLERNNEDKPNDSLYGEDGTLEVFKPVRCYKFDPFTVLSVHAGYVTSMGQTGKNIFVYKGNVSNRSERCPKCIFPKTS